MTSTTEHNPLLSPSTLDYQLPDFAAIRFEHFRPAFTEAMRRHEEEIREILRSEGWEDVVERLEASGRDLARVESVFFNLCNTDSTEEMLELAAELAPELAAHRDAIIQNTELYQLVRDAEVPEDEESRRLHEYYLRLFARSGATLDAEKKAELAELNRELSSLSERFGSQLLSDTQKLAVSFDSEEELAGLSASAIASAREEDGSYVLHLNLPSVQSVQAQLERPESRRRVYEASLARGVESTTPVAVRMAQLRARKAELLGYSSHAELVVEEETAPDTAAVWTLLRDLAPAAAANAYGEYKRIQDVAGGEEITAADWPYWENKLREQDYALDESQLREYFPLRSVVEKGVFFAAERLYGITVHPREDLRGYHEDVQVWEVRDSDGTGIGLLLTDYYARPSKRGGAWMSGFVEQSELLGTKPVVINVLNITKPADGSEALLSMDEVTTLFHEFGHGLHGLLSQVRYPSFSGTSVPRDYVEFPSQINENWALEPVVLDNYARHHVTGEVIPAELVSAIHASRTFGQGFATSEYLGAAIIDYAWHSLSAAAAEKIAATPEAVAEFERAALSDAGLEVEHLAPRYQTRYFNHIFAGGYSAGYYSYLWAEALDADGFEWFKEVGGAVDAERSEDSPSGVDAASVRAAGQRFRELVLSRGASRDFTEAFTTLRGREKDIQPLLQRRGLAGATR
ncbi:MULTISPECIES: M3 family metallopeptidase [Corynebacterium]|uniref:M3 family metallopeptidase n=1 Tax=Corynebacterium TaxID=1716 RepID=UPI00124EF7C0|nr:MULTISPECIES: M3 family metallopeptidase [Corynebacterium]